MKLTSDNETLAENKVLILYLLNKVGKPLTNNELYKLVLSIEDMNYFYFQQFLLDLIENKYLINYEKNSFSLYEMTQLGKDTLELTKDILPGIKKLKIDRNFKSELDDIEEEISIVAEYTPNNDKDYTVSCKIIENNVTTFEVKTFVGSRERAKTLADNWKNNAIDIYPKVLNILLDSNNSNDKN